MQHGQTNMGGGEDRFRTTRWSLISEIRNPHSKHSRDILNNLFYDYWKPVYCYIRAKGNDNEKAKDMTQEFFCSILFEKNLFAKAQKSKGKFRSLLLTALQNFLISQNRYQEAQKRVIDREILNVDLLDTASLTVPIEPDVDGDGFNYAWIASLLDNAAKRVRAEYCSKGKELHWIAFDKRFLQPILHNTAAPALCDICKDDGIADEVKASNMITSVKRTFQKELRSLIREYVQTDNDVDEELSELLAFLGKFVQD